ncbi:MAG: diaminopimelate decarboxylase [Syntrophomonadaceae bacterium]
MHLPGTMTIDEKGHLQIGGIDACDLAREFSTPLWVIDEQGLRESCRSIKNAFAGWGDSLVIYACKALCCMALCRIVEEEGLGLDVVSGGELYTALKAGFDPQKIYFHGNNKSPEEIDMAIKAGVGRIVVDNFLELSLLAATAQKWGKKQDILLRITPGVEAHTHEYIKTGQIDSKFGFSLPGGQAMKAVESALESDWLNLVGIHCHIGSQIFEMESFRYTTSIMMNLVGEIKEKTGHVIDELDLGGGFGIYYSEGDQPVDYEEWAKAIMPEIQEIAEKLKIKPPLVIVEPGRCICGPAGITLYTLGSSKEVEGIRKYLAVDGGMNDNPRPALYGAKYRAIIANKAAATKLEKVSIAGKCCESGDMLIWDIELPQAESGDILAVFDTGAYTYSMSSNYNRLPKPAIVLVNQGQADVIVKREDYEDLLRNDLIPARIAKK